MDVNGSSHIKPGVYNCIFCLMEWVKKTLIKVIYVTPFLGVRLVGGSWEGEGRVEIFYNGNWGTVCDYDWDLIDARVVCRQMGFPDAVSAPRSAHFGTGSGPTWLNKVYCHGGENSIEKCWHKGWGVEDCDHNQDASVICSSKSSRTQYRTISRISF